MACNAYERAREVYAKLGIDTEKAMETLMKAPVSIHCWQGDDVIGFDGVGEQKPGDGSAGDCGTEARHHNLPWCPHPSEFRGRSQEFLQEKGVVWRWHPEGPWGHYLQEY